MAVRVIFAELGFGSHSANMQADIDYQPATITGQPASRYGQKYSSKDGLLFHKQHYFTFQVLLFKG